MSTIFVAAESRPLPLRKRPDVQAVSQRLKGERLWTLKDPASLRYFHISEEERFLYEQLDGCSSLTDIKSRFEARFAPQRITLAQLQGFVGTLHRQGLLLGDTAGQGDVLLNRKREQRRQERLTRLASLLALRFRGVDPHAILDIVYPRIAWIFSRFSIATFGLLVLSALAMVAVHWSEVTARLPHFEQFLGGSNLLWLALTLGGIKVLHELAHALTLKHFGGDCHEIGPMLLLFTPCLYCNTTDAWMLPSKWQRAAVAAAGIGVEAVLAAVATFFWWWSEPGLFNSMCLNVMIVGSVSTLLFNGNPLLRYDGYYVLSDLAEIPNLAQQSSAVVRSSVAGWMLGSPVPVDRLYGRIEQRGWLTTYWVASFSYRVFLLWTILWGLHKLLGPRHLDAVVVIVALVAIAGLVLPPVLSVIRTIRDPQWKDRVRFRQFATRVGAVATIGLLLGLIPLPARVTAPAVIRPANADRLYVTQAGMIVSTLLPGEHVKKGQTVVELRNPEVQLAAERARQDRDRQQLHLENLRRQSFQSEAATEAIPAAETALADQEKRLQERLAEVERLTIRSPRNGVLLAPPSQSAEQRTNDLGQWTGTPLEPRNVGANLATGTLVGLIGDPEQLEATLLVEQGEITLIRPGQQVSLRMDLNPGQMLDGEIVDLSPSRVDELPRELVAIADIPQKTDSQGRAMPLGKIYQARVKLTGTAVPLLIGAVGRARIHVAPQSLFERFGRFLSSTFRVDW